MSTPTVGIIIPNAPIAVDLWRSNAIRNARLLFLSHAHSDHMQGLSPSINRCFYTSPLTAKIVRHLLKIPRQYILPLEVGHPHLLTLEENGHDRVIITVTLFDANHCPGAVMFLFEGYFGRVLYTGDFRFDAGIPEEIVDACSEVDVLYLDNTYTSSEKQDNLMPRSVVTEQIVTIIRKYIDTHNIVIGIRTLGKEDLLIHIAEALRRKIGVSEAKMGLLKVIGAPLNWFRIADGTDKIRTETFQQLKVKNVKMWNLETPTIAILPTGLSRHFFGSIPEVNVFPYSDHASPSELKQFLNKVRPSKILPVVSSNKSIYNSDMRMFDNYLSPPSGHSVVVPRLLKDLVGKNMLNESPRRISSLRQKKFSFSSPKGVVFVNDTPFEERLESQQTTLLSVIKRKGTSMQSKLTPSSVVAETVGKLKLVLSTLKVTPLAPKETPFSSKSELQSACLQLECASVTPKETLGPKKVEPEVLKSAPSSSSTTRVRVKVDQFACWKERMEKMKVKSEPETHFPLQVQTEPPSLLELASLPQPEPQSHHQLQPPPVAHGNYEPLTFVKQSENHTLPASSTKGKVYQDVAHVNKTSVDIPTVSYMPRVPKVKYGSKYLETLTKVIQETAKDFEATGSSKDDSRRTDRSSSRVQPVPNGIVSCNENLPKPINFTKEIENNVEYEYSKIVISKKASPCKTNASLKQPETSVNNCPSFECESRLNSTETLAEEDQSRPCSFVVGETERVFKEPRPFFKNVSVTIVAKGSRREKYDDEGIFLHSGWTTAESSSEEETLENRKRPGLSRFPVNSSPPPGYVFDYSDKCENVATELDCWTDGDEDVAKHAAVDRSELDSSFSSSFLVAINKQLEESITQYESGLSDKNGAGLRKYSGIPGQQKVKSEFVNEIPIGKQVPKNGLTSSLVRVEREDNAESIMKEEGQRSDVEVKQEFGDDGVEIKRELVDENDLRKGCDTEMRNVKDCTEVKEESSPGLRIIKIIENYDEEGCCEGHEHNQTVTEPQVQLQAEGRKVATTELSAEIDTSIVFVGETRKEDTEWELMCISSDEECDPVSTVGLNGPVLNGCNLVDDGPPCENTEGSSYAQASFIIPATDGSEPVNGRCRSQFRQLSDKGDKIETVREKRKEQYNEQVVQTMTEMKLSSLQPHNPSKIRRLSSPSLFASDSRSALSGKQPKSYTESSAPGLTKMVDASLRERPKLSENAARVEWADTRRSSGKSGSQMGTWCRKVFEKSHSSCYSGVESEFPCRSSNSLFSTQTSAALSQDAGSQKAKPSFNGDDKPIITIPKYFMEPGQELSLMLEVAIQKNVWKYKKMKKRCSKACK